MLDSQQEVQCLMFWQERHFVLFTTSCVMLTQMFGVLLEAVWYLYARHYVTLICHYLSYFCRISLIALIRSLPSSTLRLSPLIAYLSACQLDVWYWKENWPSDQSEAPPLRTALAPFSSEALSPATGTLAEWQTMLGSGPCCRDLAWTTGGRFVESFLASRSSVWHKAPPASTTPTPSGQSCRCRRLPCRSHHAGLPARDRRRVWRPPCRHQAGNVVGVVCTLRRVSPLPLDWPAHNKEKENSIHHLKSTMLWQHL